jgi:hypothetical protein
MEQVGLVTNLLQMSYVNLVHKDCALNKQNQLMVQNKIIITKLKLFQLVHTNLCETFVTKFLIGVFYILTFINDYNFYGWVDFL